MQGDRSSGFYLLVEGRIKIYKLLPNGRTATIRHAGPGDVFAEATLFQDTYAASSETMSDCRLLRFGTHEFLDLLRAEPQLAINLLAAMAELLVFLTRRVEELLLPVPARLARYLLRLAAEQLVPPLTRVSRRALASSGCPPASASWRRASARSRRRSAGPSTASSALG